jgi:hypothetical protein
MKAAVEAPSAAQAALGPSAAALGRHEGRASKTETGSEAAGQGSGHPEKDAGPTLALGDKTRGSVV